MFISAGGGNGYVFLKSKTIADALCAFKACIRHTCLIAITGCTVPFLAATAALANDDKTVSAFTNFLAKQDYNNANFYLQSALIDPSQLETGQIFYDLYRRVYWKRQASGLSEANVLYEYLKKLRPFDLNAIFSCKTKYQSDKKRCTLLNDLSNGMPVPVFAFFAQRGLDLNRTFDSILPASFDIIDRIGTSYSLADIQTLSRLGMVFGDETYSSAMLAAHREVGSHYGIDLDDQIEGRHQSVMPQNYLSIPRLNFMDVLVIALANRTRDSGRGAKAKASLRDTLLCQYITFSSRSFRPSFDYLRFVLENRTAFRASQIGVRIRDGNTTAEPFAAACVQLVAGMARNHTRLDDVVSYFGAQGDVDTARWLLALRQPGPPPVVSSGPGSTNDNGAQDSSGPSGGTLTPTTTTTD